MDEKKTHRQIRFADEDTERLFSPPLFKAFIQDGSADDASVPAQNQEDADASQMASPLHSDSEPNSDSEDDTIVGINAF